MKRIALLSLLFLFIIFQQACSTQTSIANDRPNALWISASKTSKTFSTTECDLTLSFLGMQDSAFTFEIALSNFTDRTISLSCEKSKIEIDNCIGAFGAKIRDLNRMQLDVESKKQNRVLLQFRAPEMRAMICWISSNTIFLSGVSVVINNKEWEYGTIQFESSMVRLLKQ